MDNGAVSDDKTGTAVKLLQLALILCSKLATMYNWFRPEPPNTRAVIGALYIVVCTSQNYLQVCKKSQDHLLCVDIRYNKTPKSCKLGKTHDE